MKQCIYCGNYNSGGSVEHIIPEALGCPENFIFTDGEVCGRCNNNLGDIDQAVINDFDYLLFTNNIPRKKGRPPAIDSRGNMTGYYVNGKPEITINMGPGAQTDGKGVNVAPYSGNERHVRCHIEPMGDMANVSMKMSIGSSKKFRRGAYKIALGSLAYFLGHKIALKEGLDPVRKFIRNGAGDRILMFRTCDDTEFRNEAWPPYVSTDGQYSVVIRLAVVELLMDLSSDGSHSKKFIEKAVALYGKNGWTYTPTNA